MRSGRPLASAKSPCSTTSRRSGAESKSCSPTGRRPSPAFPGTGRLPASSGCANKPTLAVIGAGTGLGTTVLSTTPRSGKYRPVPGEGGHTDFTAIEEDEFRIAQWIRRNVNFVCERASESRKGRQRPRPGQRLPGAVGTRARPRRSSDHGPESWRPTRTTGRRSSRRMPARIRSAGRLSIPGYGATPPQRRSAPYSRLPREAFSSQAESRPRSCRSSRRGSSCGNSCAATFPTSGPS